MERSILGGRRGAGAQHPGTGLRHGDPGQISPVRTRPPAGSSGPDDHAVLLALGTVGDGPIDRLRAGEATGAVLLTATARGLATCPLTEPLEVPECRAQLRTDVFGDDLFPQMLVRVGWAPANADALPATGRRPLADVVTWNE